MTESSLSTSTETDTEAVKELMRSIDALPSPPAVATRILSSAAEDADFDELSRYVSLDQSLALKVLQIANSPAYARRGKVADISQAAVVLGLATLKNILLGSFIRETFLKGDRSPDTPGLTIWRHSLTCACASELLTEKTDPQLAGPVFSACMIHDCGKLAMLSALPGYETLLKRHGHGEALCRAEREAYGADHALAARWLLAHWGLPQETIDTIWMHHQPVDTLSESDNRLASLVNLSNRLAHEAMADHADPEYHQHTETCLRALNIDTSVVDEIMPAIGQLYADRASIFDLSGNAEEFYFQALQRANRSLSSMGTQATREHELLDRTNAILSAVNTAARKLEGVASRKDALTTVVQVLQGMGAQPGCAFLVGPKGFSGLRWDDRKTAVFSALPEELAFTLPKPLGTIAHGFAARGNGYAGAPRQVQDYLTADIFLADKRYGELIFKLPVREGDTVSEQEALAVSQLASHLGAALERIRLADQLEERAERLTDALRKLQQANLKMMQTERLAAVGQLAAGAAHEINNPLAIIYARTQILESREPDDTKKRQFRQMMEQIERITAILNGLMDFARPAPPKLEPVSLTKIADRALSLFESGLDKHKLTINRRYDRESEHPVVHADPGQMEPVVLNLLINAEHAMAESGRDSILDVWVTHDSSTGNGMLKVVDNGVGIEEKHIKCIFDPFFTTKEEGKGTGLGLSTSHATIRSHGGQIRVSSEPGKGTEFTVELPLAEPEQQTEDTTADTRTESPAVLVVDDEQSIRDILVEALTGAGYDAETARSGDQALHQLQDKKYKLVLLDLRMPGMDGLTFLEELKRRATDVPVLVLTGMAGEEEVERALQLGALKCLKKPFQIRPLLEEVKAVMQKDKVWLN